MLFFANTRKFYQSFPPQQNETEVYFTEEKRWIKGLKPSALPVKREPTWWKKMNERKKPTGDSQPKLTTTPLTPFSRPPSHHIIFKPWIPTTSFLTATALIYTIGAGITAAAGTRLSLQLFLAKGFKLFSFQSPDLVQAWYCYLLSLPLRIGIG